MNKSKKKLVKNILLIFGLVCLIIIFKKSPIFKNYSPTYIKDYINSYGAIAPIVYIIIFTLVALVIIPNSVVAIAGGMAFGIVKGTFYTVLGALGAASLAFFVARFLGRSIVEKLMKGKGKLFEDGVEKNGFLLILLLRLIPLIPFDIISYGAGLSKIKFKDLVLGTLIGVIPGVLVFVNIGDKSLNIKSKGFIISILFLIALIIVSCILKKNISFDKLQKDMIRKGDNNG